MRRLLMGVVTGLAVTAAPVAADVSVTLRGSMASMERQHGVAVEHGYPFAASAAELARLEAAGELVSLDGNADYELSRVSQPVARPEVRLLIERVAAQYRQACGEKLVVTSLSRPQSRQPRNSHALSVHPAGIAVDLRISRKAECRSWLEDTLLGLEERGLLDVTRERYPPHYHVALFPEAYAEHAEPLMLTEEAAVRVAAVLRLGQPVRPAATARAAEPVRQGGFSALAMLPFLLGVVGVTVRLRRAAPAVRVRSSGGAV